jgi:hypothetical protein
MLVNTKYYTVHVLLQLKELSIGFNLLRNLSSLITDNLIDLLSLKASMYTFSQEIYLLLKDKT